jgi:imidazolonepropionase-like amidohydrolase
MSWRKRLVPVTLGLLVATAATGQPAGSVKTTAVKCGHLIDVKAGTSLAGAVILIENGRITAAGPGVKVPAGARVIDLGDATVDAADLLGWQTQVGSLEPGRYADLIAVPGDPWRTSASSRRSAS